MPLLTIESYYSTCLKLLLLFGVAFELPVLICLLGVLGVVDSKLLREYRRHAILFITVISALFAPPDAISMLILGIPLIFLYEGSILVVHFLGIKKLKSGSSTGIQVKPPSTPKHPWEGRSQ